MAKVWVCWLTALCVSTACGNGDDDTSNAAGTGPSAGTGGSSAGTGGSSAASGGSGAGLGGSSSGQSGSGGSMAGASGGRGGSGTGGSTGGSQAGRGGSGGQMIPPPTGMIGSGVMCPLSDATECPDAKACCHASSGATCESAFSDCTCSLTGTCLVLGCDSPSDCAGARCCALLNPRLSPVYHATSCKPACESGERQVCVTNDDCDSGEQCMHGSQGFDFCF
jgi:hypothetical protein